jgi:hypothetical protein
MAVIHDLRLDIDGRVAQIDHLLIHRSLNCFVLETKQVHAGLKITETGEFLRWNDWKRAAYRRAAGCLPDTAFAGAGGRTVGAGVSFLCTGSVQSPHRPAGELRQQPRRQNGPVARCRRKRSRPGRCRVRPDRRSRAEQVSRGRLENLARQLLALYRPASFDYRRKFGLSGNGTAESAGTAESFRSSGQQREPLRLEFPPGWPETQWKRQGRRSSTRGYDRRLGYAAVGLVLVLIAINGIPRKATTTVQRAAPPVSRSGPAPAYGPRPAAPAATTILRFDSPVPEKPVPPAPVRALPAEPAPALRWDERSLTATGKGGAPLAELRGNLPKIKQEMRASGLGARKPGYAGSEAAAEPAATCEPKPVMTDAEIAACRNLARRP